MKANTNLPTELCTPSRDAIIGRYAELFWNATFHYTGWSQRYHEYMTRSGNVPWRILRYIHIANPEELPLPVNYNAYVRPETFESNLRQLSRNFNVIPLKKLLEMIENGSPVSDRTVCLTFDHAYSDFYFTAFPILKMYHLPATVFISSSYPDTPFLLWHDYVLQSLLTIKAEGLNFPNLPMLGAEFDNSINSITENREINIAAASYLVTIMNFLTAESRTNVIDRLRDIVNAYGGLPETNLYITWDQAREMQQSDLISYGTHGHISYCIEQLTREALAHDIRTGLQTLREQELNPLDVLAFPEGIYTENLLTVLGDMGLRYAMAEQTNREIDTRRKGNLLFNRIHISESVASSVAIFNCRVHSLRYSNQRYVKATTQ